MATSTPSVPAEILNAISAEVAKQNAAGSGWSAPSTYLFAAGTLLEGSDVAQAAAQVGWQPGTVLGLAALGGLFVALGGVLLAHGH